MPCRWNSRASRSIKPATLRKLILLLVAVVGLTKLLDLGLVELNRRGVVLPQFDLSLVPYHDPRVTKRNALLLDYQEPPQIIFTGDSRTKNGIVPEVISRTLGVSETTFFNFGTGSQVVKFAREAFVPHLLQIGVRPNCVVFGVSPDWPLRKERLWTLIDRYRDSLAYRIANQNWDGSDAVEDRLSRFLALRLAFFRYRARPDPSRADSESGLLVSGRLQPSCRRLAGGQATSFQGSGTTLGFQDIRWLGPPALRRTHYRPFCGRNLDSQRHCLSTERTFSGCSARCETRASRLSC